MNAGVLAPVFRGTDRAGVLIRDARVTLVNLSSSGCLIETDRCFEVGTIASLRLVLAGREGSDDVQVVRCQRLEGAGSRYHVGVQFLWTTVPGRSSLRRAAQDGAAQLGAPGASAV
jgi:PilZ domain